MVKKTNIMLYFGYDKTSGAAQRYAKQPHYYICM